MTDLILPVSVGTLVDASLVYLVFLTALLGGAILLPGLSRIGFPQPDGERKQYKLTGLTLFAATHVVIALGMALLGWSLTFVLSHFWSLLIVSNAAAIAISLWLLVKGRHEIEGRGIGPVARAMWLGAQRNPTVFGVDLKMFAYQPSLIGLGLVIAAFGYRQVELYGALTPQMMLFLAFWWAYLFTHYINEAFMLSTWDIIAENFGFMLVWGDLVYVPFFYSLCGWFLVDDQTIWSPWALGALAALHVAGHMVFRGANWQKDRYKRDRTRPIWGRPPKTIGDRLLVSGWWGLGRKVNYTGELVVYLSFALCCGTTSWIPYLLPLSLLVLLVQRAARDDRRCRAKYGDLWREYCQVAKFRVIPFLY